MNPVRLGMAAAALALSSSGCTGGLERSRARWEALYTPQDQRKWQRCIEDGAAEWWTRRFVGEPADPDTPTILADTADEAFTAILAGCRVHTETPWWASLPPKRQRRMIGDARVRFEMIGAQVSAQISESII